MVDKYQWEVATKKMALASIFNQKKCTLWLINTHLLQIMPDHMFDDEWGWSLWNYPLYGVVLWKLIFEPTVCRFKHVLVSLSLWLLRVSVQETEQICSLQDSLSTWSSLSPWSPSPPSSIPSPFSQSHMHVSYVNPKQNLRRVEILPSSMWSTLQSNNKSQKICKSWSVFLNNQTT